MAFVVKCEHANLEITKVDNGDIIKITYENIELRLYKFTKVQDLCCKVYNCYDKEYEPESSIEICLANGCGDFIFIFPYEKRYTAMSCYDELFRMLKDFN